MTTRYCGAGGSDANSGLSWALRKATLNGIEDSPVAAGDVCYIGPGTYRELLTVDVSGSSGSPITYVGDYTGANTDGVGGLVRITGAASPDTSTGTRANCISLNTRSYRTFTGFLMDGASGAVIGTSTAGTDNTISKCVILPAGSQAGIDVVGSAQLRWTISGCKFIVSRNGAGVQFTHSSAVDNAGHVVESSQFLGGNSSAGILDYRVGGITIRNNLFFTVAYQVWIVSALTVGQTLTVNNNIFTGAGGAGITATTTAEVVENYNTFHNNATNRTNVSTGANSVFYPYHWDARGFFESANGGTMVTPYDLASYSPLIEYSAGTGAPSTDMRGSSVVGSLREWGPLEYNSALTIEAGGGGIVVSPLGQQIIQALLGGSQ